MNCPCCNTLLAEDAKFCTACGKRIQPPTPTVTPNKAEKKPLLRSTNPALNVIKTIGASPLFLTLTILFSASLIFSVLYALFGIPRLIDDVVSLMREVQVTLYMGEISSAVQLLGDVLSSIILVAIIPAALTAISLWITYFSARSLKNGGINTTGLSIIYGIVVWELVLICLAALVMLLTIGILVVVALTVEPIETETMIAMIVAAVAFVITLGICVVVILYEVFMLRSLRTVKRTALTGEASDKVSLFAAIVLIILGVISSFNAIFAFDVTLFFSTACSAAATIIGGILMLSYRNEMKRFLEQEKTAATPAEQPAEE